jgi:uncharacterized membrane protein YdfJ with MMPL/SSD domain
LEVQVMKSEGLAVRAGRWSAHHRKRAILLWVAFVIASLVVGGAIGTKQIGNDGDGTGSSGRADAAVNKLFPQPDQEDVIVQARGRGETVHSPAFEAAVADVVTRLHKVSVVDGVQSPYSRGNGGQISRDGRSVLVQFNLPGDSNQVNDDVTQALAAVAAAQRAHPQLTIQEFGSASANKALGNVLSGDLHRAERLSIPITLLILVVVFGALVAAAVPVLLALSAVAATLGLIALPSHLVAFDGSASSVIVLIGMAVGIDYALFYIRREREERAAGRSSQEALERAAATSGRAVLVSGMTVMIAMAGMFLVGNATFTSFAVGTMTVVAVAMLGSVTFLPAMLAALGDRIDKGRIPGLARRPHRGRSSNRATVSARLLRPVLAHPRIGAIAALALLAALAVPALSLHTAEPGVRDVPANLPVMKTYARIQTAFPGSPAPAQVVLQDRDVDAPAVRSAVAHLERDALRSGEMGGPTSVVANRARTLAIVQLSLDGDGTDATSYRALDTLRNRLIPETLGQVPGVTANVTGTTAGSQDFNGLLSRRAPLVFVFVLGLAFVLLLVTFRSLVIPITAIGLNLLSVAAAYGALALVFQHHWAQKLLGFTSIGGVTSWLPLFLFVILFGLSMDYHVFILSRIKEAHDRGMSTKDAVAHGIGSTAGVVTSAAVVMVAVFSIFGSLSMLELKEFGVGLAVAVLVDAIIIRGVLLPATMTILGEHNWYLPAFLHRRVPRERVSALADPRVRA